MHLFMKCYYILISNILLVKRNCKWYEIEIIMEWEEAQFAIE